MQAKLPVLFGGLGIRQPSDIAHPGFLASFAESRLVTKILSKLPGSLRVNRSDVAATRWTELHGGMLKLDQGATNRQSTWDTIQCRALCRDGLSGANTLERARLLGAQAPHSGSWLQSVPIANVGTMLDNQALRVAIALTVGSTVCEPFPCPCGAVVDQMGLHPLSCRLSAGRAARHAALNETVRRAIGRCGLAPVLEPPGLDRGMGSGLTASPSSPIPGASV